MVSLGVQDRVYLPSSLALGRLLVLYAHLPPLVNEHVNSMHPKFNASINDVFIWSNNKHDTYTTRNGSAPNDRLIKWNNNNHSFVIHNIDGSCLGSPIRAGFGGIFRNNVGYYLSGFSGFIHDSSDSLLAALYAIFHVLIQDIKDLLSHSNITVCYTLREGNQCADFLAKLGASSDNDLLIHNSSPEDMLDLLRSDVAGTFFLGKPLSWQRKMKVIA
ncbi:replication protein A1-like protein, partial [Trifolium medium]|nr:replication protein A1-like protein [Trifolium medium]